MSHQSEDYPGFIVGMLMGVVGTLLFFLLYATTLEVEISDEQFEEIKKAICNE